MKKIGLLIMPLMAVSFLVSCGGNKTKEYTAKWLDYNGNVLKEEKCKEGSVPVYEDATHGTPTRESDAFHDYTFAAWAPTPTEIHSDQAYVATYDELSFDTQVYMQVNITDNKSFTFYQNIISETYTQGIFVDWGDGQNSTVKTPAAIHNYNNSGAYNIRISGGVTDIELHPDSRSFLEKAYFGHTLTEIVFQQCTNLKSVIFAENSTLTEISINAFYRCSSLTSINIPSSVTSIGNNAFYRCSSLTSINIPSSVTSIGSDAFSGCSSLTSINIPSSVTSINDLAFGFCSSLETITVSEENETYDSRNNCNAIIETNTNTLIIGCKGTTIPDSVTSIGGSAFYRCSSLTSINIPSGVTSIETYAFGYCPNLAKIIVDINNQYFTSQNENKDECNAIITKKETPNGILVDTLVAGCKNTEIPNRVTSIAEAAFSGCSDLASINIPSSVISIGYGAFCDCTSLTKVDLTAYTTVDEVPSYDDSVFDECPSELKFHVADDEMKGKFIEQGWPEAQIVIGK